MLGRGSDCEHHSVLVAPDGETSLLGHTASRADVHLKRQHRILSRERRSSVPTGSLLWEIFKAGGPSTMTPLMLDGPAPFCWCDRACTATTMRSTAAAVRTS